MTRISTYPLHHLESDITPPIQISKGVKVISNNISHEDIDKINVSKAEAHHIKDTDLCLEIDADITPPEKASISFIMCCRLLKRTKVFIRYIVDSSGQVRKIRDDYPFVTSNNVTALIKKNEFNKIIKLYEGLDKFKRINKRTNNAVYFLSMAYRSRGWLESLIFHVCALETLTSSENRETQITKKFKERIHNFIGYNEKKLEKIYNIRSELVHGRHSSKSNQDNLRLNRIAEAACRKMFAKILTNSAYIDAFVSDNTRMNLF